MQGAGLLLLTLRSCMFVPQVSIADNSTGPLSDEAIGDLLQQHLGMPAFLTAAKQQPPRSASISTNSGPKQHSNAAGRASKQPGSAGARPKAGQAAAYESVEAFVGVMGKLLDMEREAEVAAAQEATSLCSTTAAQVRLWVKAAKNSR